MDSSILDVNILLDVIQRRNLPFCLGNRTAPNGNCYLNAIQQNFEHYARLGLIRKENVPRDIQAMRQEVIQFMVRNKNTYVHQNGPMTEESFNSLILDQKRDGAYTDLDGWFVKACAEVYNFELQILQTHDETAIIESGVGGPLIKINSSQENENKIKFYVGFIRNEQDLNAVGHFQFIYHTSTVSISPLADPSGNLQSPVKSPVKLSRSRIVSRYIKSPSPKKRLKPNHCYYCNQDYCTPTALETHLTSSVRCLEFYKQSFKTKDITAFLVSSSPCLFCSFKETFRISVHLKRSKSCFDKYCQKFKCTSIEILLDKLEKLKRKMRGSRSRAKRRLETQKARLKKEDKEAKLTETDLINQFKRDTALSNVRQCVVCEANMSENRAKEIKKEDLPEELKIKLKSRRFEKFFLCLHCQPEKKPQELVSKIMMKTLKFGENVIYIPSTDNDRQIMESQSNQDEIVTEKCLFPCTIESINELSSVNIKSRQQDLHAMYKVGPLSSTEVSVMYENEASKYQNAMQFGKRFSGVISTENSKLLSSTERVRSDHLIIGSDSWRDIEKRNHIHKMELFGSVFCFVSIRIPIGVGTLASSLIQTGVVITVNFKEDGNGEFHTEYLVHFHGPERDCIENCPSLALEEYILCHPEISEDKAKKNHLSACVSMVQLKLNSFVRSFVKSQASFFYSEDFSLEVKFHSNGNISIDGSLWLKEFEELNVSFGSYPAKQVDIDLKHKLSTYIDKFITTSTDMFGLKEQFDLSDAISERIANASKTHQLHLCDDSNCDRCQNPQLPSMMTMFIETPELENQSNLETSSNFCKVVSAELNATPRNLITTLISEDWLKSIFSATVYEFIDDELLRAKHSNQTFDFIIDERFKNLLKIFKDPVMTAYHYSITCGEIRMAYTVIFRTKRLLDCYTSPFSPNLMRAFDSSMEIRILNGHQPRGHFEANCLPDLDGISEGLLATHNVVTMAEAFFLFDKNLCRTSNSTSVEFVNAVKERKSFFQKVTDESETTFKDEKGNLFEQLPSNIDRYLGRRNGLSLTLAEFCCCYEFVGREESRQLMKILRNPEVDIKPSELKCANCQEECLPEFIVTNLNDVMKLRNKRKVMAYPSYEDNPKKLTFTKVLLFFPIKDEIPDEDTVSCLASTIVESSDQISPETIIDRNERYR